MRKSLQRHSLHALLLGTILSGSYIGRAQDGLKQSITISGTEVKLPANGSTYPDSLRQHVPLPAQVLMQFSRLPGEAAKKELEASGIQLLDYLEANTFIAYIRSAKTTAVPGLRSIVLFQPLWKIEPHLAALTSSGGNADIIFSCVPGVSRDEVYARIKSLGGYERRNPLEEHALFEASLPAAQIKSLAAWSPVRIISLAAKAEPLNQQSTRATKANIAQAAVSNGGYNLLGDSVTIGVGDNTSGLYHIDVRDRITNYNYALYSNHGQHVNGTVGSAGILDPNATGFAPHAKLIDHLYDMVWKRTGAMVAAYNMSVTNNSYGNRLGDCSYEGTYDIYSQILDTLALEYPNVLHVFASGNDGTLTCSPYPTGYRTVVGGYQAAKNVIVVANAKKDYSLNAGSSKGPLRDGRVRPDIAAIGTSVYSTKGPDLYLSATGTSMASPEVAGAAGLLQQHYKRTHSGSYPTSLLTKTLLMNGALDLGNRGPDFMFGYGMMDLSRSLKMIDSGWYVSSNISNGNSQTPVTIPVPANTAQLKVMLAWHDVPASPAATNHLVNDLDLKVTDPSAVVHLPYVLNPASTNVTDTATAGTDHLNNVEQVVISNPASGSYAVGVTGYAVPYGPQAYVVAYDIIPAGITIASPFPGGAYNTNTAASAPTIYWNASDDPNTFSIEYSTNGGTNWTTLSSSVPATDRQYSWTPAAGTNSAQCYVRITRNVTNEQATVGPFTINDQPALSLNAIQCPGYVNMHWTSVANATSYSILRKVGYYLQPVAATTDTFYNASGLRTDSIYYFAVQPVFGTVGGYRSMGVSRKPDTGSCTGTFSDNDLMMDKVTVPGTGRIGTGTALGSNQTLSVLIRNLDDAAVSSYKVSYQLNSGTWQSQTLSSLAANSAATVSFTGLNMSAAGTYTIRAAIQNLSGSDPVSSNDTIVTTVRQLQNNALNLSSAAFSDDFESLPAMTLLGDTMGFTSNEHWDYFNNNDTGRMRTFVDSEITIGGNRSISMDMLYQTFPPPAYNRLVGTFDLSGYNSNSEIRLEFDYKLHGHPKYTDSNKVFVRGADINTWVPLLAYNQGAPAGQLIHSGSISVTDVLNAASQNYSSSTQLAFGQFDTSVIAGNEDGNGLTIDNVRLYLVTKDVGLSAVTAPDSVSCGLSSTTPLTVTVFNGVNSAVTNIGMHYQLDGGSVVNETLSSLGAKSSTSFTFSQTMNASAPGPHTVKVWTSVTGDDVPGNDTLYFTLRNEPLIASFPYLENFESSDGYWWADGYKSTWAWGAPSGLTIRKAASGSKAWKTNLTGYYNDREVSYLYSPCFDISSLSNPMLSFSLNTEIENCGSILCDGAWMEYSVGGGAWTKLGSSSQGTNWYNSSAFQLWNVQSPARWRVASIPLPTTSQTIRFRFVFNADEGTGFDGIAVDDIHIFDRTNPVYSGGAIGPITQTVSGSGYTTFASGGAVLAQISAGNSSSLGSTDVTLYDHSNIINAASQQYYLPKNFVVNTQNTPTDSVTARLFITDADVLTLVNATGCSGCSKPADAYELGITKYDNSNTALENGSLSDNSGGTYIFIPYTLVKWVPYDSGYYGEVKLTSFSELWFNNGGPANSFPLPVAGVDFDARKSGETAVLITWLCHVDTQVMYYEVQRSNDAHDWKPIATVPPVHDNAHAYSYTDHPGVSSAPAYYYRLKYTLQNNQVYYSAMRQVIWSGGNAGLSVYPNPATDGIFHIDWSTQPGNSLEAKVTDIAGRTIRKWSETASDYSNTTTLDLAGAAKGIYFLHVAINGERFDIKLVRQ
jgi:hypothetical protein